MINFACQLACHEKSAGIDSTVCTKDNYTLLLSQLSLTTQFWLPLPEAPRFHAHIVGTRRRKQWRNVGDKCDKYRINALERRNEYISTAFVTRVQKCRTPEGPVVLM